MNDDPRYEELLARLRGPRELVVAFSGGVDSSFLLAAAAAALPARVRAVIGVSPALQEENLAFARRLAARVGVPLLEIESRELENAGYVANGPDRCFHCKDTLYSLLERIADAAAGARVLDGTNADDLRDVRPGRAAARLHGVESPLAEAGWSKADVRRQSRRLGLEGWDRPATPCLSSRIPHGTRVTEEALLQIARAETALRALGLREVRVRHHGELARVKVPRADVAATAARAEEIVAALRGLGYQWTTIDLEGYRPSGQPRPIPGRAGGAGPSERG